MKIFITGGTSGIGLELASRYVKRGDEVAICGRDISKVPQGIRSKVHCYELSVHDHEKLSQAITDFAHGKLDILIASAGISVGKKTDLPHFDRARLVINTNVIGVINGFEAALKNMNSGGHLVAISSIAGLAGIPRVAAYSASKSAVLTLCESLSISLRKRNIDVTCICPGYIDTPLTKINTHKMPFLVPLDKAIAVIEKAIDKKKKIIIFPLPMKIIALVLNKMPRWLYRFVMRFY